MTFAQRGEMLKAMSRAIHAKRDALLDCAIENGGNTRSDAKFDVDGATGTLAFYAELGEELGDVRILDDGDAVQLGRSPRLFGAHAYVPRLGVAVHVNAFNFPAWGLAEKAACALLAGMPVVTKPATSTALLSFRIVEILVAEKILPERRALASSPGRREICSSSWTDKTCSPSPDRARPARSFAAANPSSPTTSASTSRPTA